MDVKFSENSFDKTKVPIADKPLPNTKTADLFSITNALKIEKTTIETTDREAPNLKKTFTQEDIEIVWNNFVEEIRSKNDPSQNSVVQNVKLKLLEENLLEFEVGSLYLQSELEKKNSDFRKLMKEKLQNDICEFVYRVIKIESEPNQTNKQKFEELAAKNPNLYLLNEIFKFDFNS